jgi:hypothetical protein
VTSTRIKPVLLVDEAQEMHPNVLSELRILASADFDSTSLLTVILCGDGRLLELLRQEALVPLGTRIRTRHTSPDAVLRFAPRLVEAGSAALMTPTDGRWSTTPPATPGVDDYGRGLLAQGMAAIGTTR